ncbi:MAG: glycosyltransferase family 92 protein [Proteobacteria bacterium]|nr:glycosyltransferase family 92 protein [Pseudomonadota bacterium]
MKLACVAIVKNEERHIAEWLAYQFAIGFDTIILLDNQSSDATAARARAFAPSHDIRLLDWHNTASDYQLRAYEHAVHTFGAEFTWMAFFDTDEYLVIDPPFDLRAILNLWTDVPAIGIPWAMFGSSRHEERPTGLLIEDFVYRSEPGFGPNRHIKSIIRPDHMLRCENAHSFKIAGNYRSLAGTPLNFSQDGLLSSEPDYTLGKLHHYFTRSRDHWAEKMRRGYHDTTRENSEFEIYDRNEIFDDTAARHAPQVREILAGLSLPNTALTNSTRLERGNSSPQSAGPEPTNEQASTNLLQESSKELPNSSPDTNHNHPGTWALLTEFGTLLCWNADNQTLSHRPPGDLQGHHLVYWHRTTRDHLITDCNGHAETLDPITGHIAPPVSVPSLTIHPGESIGDVAFQLGNRAFLSARQSSSPTSPGTVDAHVSTRKAWECFTPITPPVAADLIALATARWVRRTGAQSPEPARIDGRHHFSIAGRSFRIEDNLPLIDATRHAGGTLTAAILSGEGGEPDEVRRFRPLIVFTLFAGEPNAEALRIAAHALHYFGDYTDECLVIGDQPANVVRALFPEPLRRHLKLHRITAPAPRDQAGALLILADLRMIADHQPIIALDPATTIAAPLAPTLCALTLHDKIAHAAGAWGFPSLQSCAPTLRAARRTLRARIAEGPPAPGEMLPTDAATLRDCAERLATIDPDWFDRSTGGDVTSSPFVRFDHSDPADRVSAMHDFCLHHADKCGFTTSTLIVGLMSDRAVLEEFQSIGDNCEFGGVQRKRGIENLGFLKWCRTTPLDLARGIDDGFRDIGNEQNFVLDDHLGEYFLTDNQYKISGHSFVKIGSVDEDQFRREQLRRLKYLRDKFMEDLEGGEYIFIYNNFKLHGQHTESEYVELMRAINARGSSRLVVVAPASLHAKQVGTVERYSQTLFRIYKDNYTTFDSKPEDYMPSWISLCRSVLQAINEDSAPVISTNAVLENT